MISETDRQRIQQEHTRAPGGTCITCTQPYPCDASRLIDELEEVEQGAREHTESHYHELNSLRIKLRVAEHKLGALIPELVGAKEALS